MEVHEISVRMTAPTFFALVNEDIQQDVLASLKEQENFNAVIYAEVSSEMSALNPSNSTIVIVDDDNLESVLRSRRGDMYPLGHIRYADVVDFDGSQMPEHDFLSWGALVKIWLENLDKLHALEKVV